MNNKKITKWLRLGILFIILGLVTYEAYMHQVLGGGKAPSIHALCPYGALESLYTLLFMGSFIKKIYSGTVVLLGITLLIAILFRRSFCGLLCPFGALQELFSIAGRKILKKRFIINEGVDKPLRYLKYFVLLLTIFMAWYYGELWMSPYDPYSAYAHITNPIDAIVEEPTAAIGFILLLVTLVGSFLYDRFFCKYLCPVGAFYGLIGKLSPTKVVRNESSCINCRLCNKACPANIDVANSNAIKSMECLSCNQCVVACPKKGALEVKVLKRSVSPIAMILVVAVLFFGTILIADGTGNYQILPAELKKGETIQVSELKGYHTIEEAALVTGVSIKDIYIKLGIPETVSKDTKMKDISKEVPTFNFDEAKESIK